jgi:tetratricopeptide (TPR) repeat protein
LVCKEAVREEMARRFYRLKSFEAIEARYQEQLQELKAKGATRAAELVKLAGERDQAKAAAEKAAEELARVKPMDTSELYQQAMRFFVQGKVDEALQILDDEKLKGAAEAARRQAGQVVGNYLLKARMLATQFKFDEAESTYQKAMTAVPESFDASFGFAVFCQELRRYGKARPAYVRALTQARLSGDQADVANTLNNLGILHSLQNQKDDARKAYEEALQTYRKLADTNPDTYLPCLATNLIILGNLHQFQNRIDEARTAFEEALKVFRVFAGKNPERYQRDVERLEAVLKGLEAKPDPQK